MSRTLLHDEDGNLTSNWFDSDKAVKYLCDYYHDGHNFICTITGSKWHHENLYITASGKFVLESFSNYQGAFTYKDTYKLISKEFALDWLVKNNHHDVVDSIDPDYLSTLEI